MQADKAIDYLINYKSDKTPDLNEAIDSIVNYIGSITIDYWKLKLDGLSTQKTNKGDDVTE